MLSPVEPMRRSGRHAVRATERPLPRSDDVMSHNRSVCAETQAASVAALPETEKAARFNELQRKLVPLWQSIERLSQDAQTIVRSEERRVGKECRL